jgi:hypothetical protein
MKGPEAEYHASTEAESDVPVITKDDYRFIQDVGGEYAGYVRFEDETLFERCWVEKRAVFDPRLKQVVETNVKVDAIFDREQGEGGELPKLSGYRFRVIEERRTDKNPRKSDVFSLFPSNFSPRDLQADQLEAIAMKAKTLALTLVGHKSYTELIEQLQNYLASEGWQGDPE